MTIRLKDREIQRHLDAISGGNFSVALNVIQEEHPEFRKSSDFRKLPQQKIVFNDDFDRMVFSVIIPADELEIVDGYDPHSWNEYPAVYPPEGVLMRVEEYIPSQYDGPEVTPEKVLGRTCAYWDGRNWVEGDQAVEPLYSFRFRPWEEEDDDD